MSKTQEEMLEAIQADFSAFNSVPEELKVDEAFVKRAVIANPVVLRNAGTFRDNEEFVKSVIPESPRALQFASDRLKNNKDLQDLATDAFKTVKIPASLTSPPPPPKTSSLPDLGDVYSIRDYATNSLRNDSSYADREALSVDPKRTRDGVSWKNKGRGGRRRKKTMKRKRNKLKRTRTRSRK